MIQEKVIKILLLSGVGIAKYFRVSMRCPKSRFPIQIIVFDKLEIIIFVSQGLTLSTASLVTQNSDAYQSNDDNVWAIVQLLQEWLDGGLPIRQHSLDVILRTLKEFIND